MIFIVKIKGAVDDFGTTQDFYFGTYGFRTKSTDTPASTQIRGNLKSAGSYSRSLDSDMPMGAMKTGYGSVQFDNHDGSLDALLDYGWKDREFKLYAKDEYGGNFPADWTLVLSALCGEMVEDGDVISMSLLDGMYSYLDKQVCSVFGGTGGLDGFANITGVAKPRVYGCPFNAPMVLFDNINNIYMMSDKPYTVPGQIFEGRNFITRMSSSWNEVSSYSALVGLSVPAGKCALVSNDSIARLAGTPIKPLTTDGGRCTSSYVSLYERTTLGKVMSDLATDAGVPSGNIDNNIETSSNFPTGLFFQDTSTKYSSAFDYAARSAGCYIGFDRLNVLRLGTWADPSGSPAFQFNPSNMLEPPTRAIILPANPLTVQVPKNWRTMSETDVATVNPASVIQAMSREYMSSVSYRPTGTRHIGQKPIELQCAGYHNNISGNNYPSIVGIPGSAPFNDNFSVPRKSFTVKSFMDLSTITATDVGTCVTLKYDRYGLDSGSLLRISGIQYDFNSLQMTFTLWG